MSGILIAGNAVHDILVRAVEELEWGRSRWVDIEHGLGGNGANTAFAAAVLGARVRLAAFIGTDAAGDDTMRRLASAGVDTRDVVRLDAATPSTVVLVNPGGARMLLHCPGASREAFPEPLEFTGGAAGGCSRFHLANAYALPHMRRHGAACLKRAREAGLATSVDTGWDSRGEWMDVLAPCLPWTDLLFVNEDEARMLTGEAEPSRAARVFRDRGARAAVVKLGAAGCAVFSEAGELRVPGFQVEAVDTTGAGDCFAGGFLAGLQRGLDMAGAARLANAAGALSVSRLGAVTGLLPFAETLEWMRSAPLSD